MNAFTQGTIKPTYQRTAVAQHNVYVKNKIKSLITQSPYAAILRQQSILTTEYLNKHHNNTGKFAKSWTYPMIKILVGTQIIPSAWKLSHPTPLEVHNLNWQIDGNRPDIILKDFRRKACHLIDMTVPTSITVSVKTYENLTKYKNFK